MVTLILLLIEITTDCGEIAAELSRWERLKNISVDNVNYNQSMEERSVLNFIGALVVLARSRRL